MTIFKLITTYSNFYVKEIEQRKSTEPKAKKGGLSQLLGKRRCAAEAKERMTLAANQVSQVPSNVTKG